jgi:hypothetical protein
MITLNQELLSIVELINSKLMGEDLLLFVMALERAGVFETVNVDGKTQMGNGSGKNARRRLGRLRQHVRSIAKELGLDRPGPRPRN